MVTLLTAQTRERMAAIVLTALLGGVLWWSGQSSWTQIAGEPLQVTLVQGAIPQDRKWRRDELEPTLERYARLSLEQQNQDLIIWPEVAIPALPFEVQDFLSTMHTEMIARDTQLFAGILTYDVEQGEYLNTLWAIGAEEGTYSKRHLVPFGEFFPVPDVVKSWLKLLNLPSEDIGRGADVQPLLLAKGVPIAATICYEIAFGGEQLRFLPEAQLLVNVSNDAWFGDSFAPHQHLQMGQMRSLETGRYLLRATNTGITAIVTAEGTVAERIAQFEPGTLTGLVEPRTGATPYVRFGNALIVSLCLLLIAGVIWLERGRLR
jgi:apolipoprotein N-acyltransferase